MFDRRKKYPTFPVKFKDVAKIFGIALPTLYKFIDDLDLDIIYISLREM